MNKESIIFHASEFILTFFTGAVIYYTIELMWRGYSHWCMALTGGLCFWALYAITCVFPTMPVFLSCVLGGAIITIAELFVGEIVNLKLGWEIWDYSSIPLNYRGQICAIFSLFWCILCLPATYLAKFLRITVFGYEL